MLFTDQLEGLPKDEEVEAIEEQAPPADRSREAAARFTKPTKGWRG